MEEIQQPADGFLEVIERLEENYENHVDTSKEDGPFIVNEDMRKFLILVEMREHMAFKRQAMIQNRLDPDANMIDPEEKLRKSILKWIERIWERRRHLALFDRIIQKIEGQYGSGVGSYFKFWNFIFYLNLLVTFLPCINFIVIPQMVQGSNSTLIRPSFKFVDLFTGMGWLEDTTLFFGSYSSEKINGKYDMPRAYFLTTMIIYLVNLVVISFTMARLFRKNFIEAQIDVPNEFCDKVYGGWDFAISSNAKFKHEELQTQLTLLLQKKNEKRKENSKVTWTSTITCMVWIWCVMVIAGLAYALNEIIDSYQASGDDSFGHQMKVTFTITGFIFGGPLLFHLVDRIPTLGKSDLSAASLRFRMYHHLGKTTLLEMTLITLFMVKYLKRGSNPDEICWENTIGQELYRLLLFFFIGIVLWTFILESFAKQISKLTEWISPPEFDIASNTMHLIYGQTLAWIGIYYSPWSSFSFLVILLLILGINYASLYLNCNISTKPWRAAQSETIFSVITFVSLIVAFGYYIAIMTYYDPSKDCGPFTNANVTKPFDVLFSDGDSKENILTFILQPGVAGLVMVFFIVVNFYVLSNSLARRTQIRDLKSTLKSLQRNNELLDKAMVKLKKINQLR